MNSWIVCINGLLKSCMLNVESKSKSKIEFVFRIIPVNILKMADSKIDLYDANMNAKFLEVRGLKSKITAFKKELKNSTVKFEGAQIDEIVKIAGPYFVSDAEKDEIRLELFTSFVVELIKKCGATFEKDVMTTKAGKHTVLIALDAVEPKDNIVIAYNEFEPKKTKKDERITAAIAAKKVLYLKDIAAFIKAN